MTSVNQITALVPMKGHSERVPGKNTKSFNGRPLLFWILRTLSRVDRVSDVVINTDSQEIASIATDHFDVRILERPDGLRGDFVSMNEIIDHDLDTVSGEHVLQTHATNPLLAPSTIEDAIERYEEALRDGYDSLFSVTPLKTRLFDADGTPLNHDPDTLGRTQDLEPIYEENSNLYIFSRTSFEKRRHRIGQTPYMFEINKLEAYDIDTPEDFRLAELLAEHKVI